MRKHWFMVVAALAALFGFAGYVQAVDAPKWVAAIFVQGQNAVGLRWNPVAGATGYKVLRSTTAGSGHAEVANVAQPQHFDNTVEAGTTYYYVLQAVAGAETSPSGEERMLVIPGQRKVATLPPVLKDAVLSQSTEFGKTNSKALISWAASSGKAIAYNVYRSTVAGKDYQMVGSVAEQQIVDTALEIGKTYYYAVTALDESFQETPRSNEVSLVVKEPEKRVASAVKKEKISLKIRSAKVVKALMEGPWGKLGAPVAVRANPDGEIAVLDSSRDCVWVFGADGEFIYKFGERGKMPGQLTSPQDLAIDPDGNMIIANNDARIEVFNKKGEPVRSIPLSTIIKDDGKKHSVGGLWAGPDSWFFTDGEEGHTYEMEYGTYKEIRHVGGPSEDPRAKEKPLGVFLGPKRLYYSTRHKALVIADTFNFRVQVLFDDGKMSAFGTYGNSVGQFARNVGLCEGPDGEIIATDFGNSTAQGFSIDGNFLYVLGNEDRTGQLPLGGNTGCDVRGNMLYMAEKSAGLVNFVELGSEITEPVKKKK